MVILDMTRLMNILYDFDEKKWKMVRAFAFEILVPELVAWQ